MLELIDTVVICTMTALTIVIARPESWLEARDAAAAGETPEVNGVVPTSDAFETGAPWSPELLAVAVALFAFSTLITWAYHTQKAWTQLTDIVDLAAAMLFACAFVNILGLYLMLPVVRTELREYWVDRKADRLVRSEA